MKQFYTSNYKRSGMNPAAIGISYVVPGSFHGITHGGLAPTLELISAVKWDTDRITQDEYAVRYIELLKERGNTPQQIIESFSDGTIFLCYEDPGEFCHRRVLADWIEEETGMFLPEWRSDKEIKSDEHNKVVDNMLDF